MGEGPEISPGCASRDRHRLRPFAGPAGPAGLLSAGVRPQGPRDGLGIPVIAADVDGARIRSGSIVANWYLFFGV